MPIKMTRTKTMVISNFHVHNILRAYSQQLSDRSRLSKLRSLGSTAQKDEVTLSSESRKRQVADRITNELIGQLTTGTEPNDTTKEILHQLSQEYGQPLDVDSDNGDGIVFRIAGRNETGATLPPAENERLRSRLFDITQSIVYNNLL
jgi:hypothetical protein